MGRRQEYIARVRYHNQLPPPPCAPKALKYTNDVDHLLTAASLSSVVFRSEIEPEPDMDLGVPLDLTLIPEAWETTDGGYQPEAPEELDPEDEELMVEPHAGVKASSTVAASKAFLTKKSIHTGPSLAVPSSSAKTKLPAENDQFDSEAALRKIGQTFDDAHVPLGELKHPKNPEAKAVKALPVFPDIQQFDLTHLNVRLVGSASLRNLPEQIPRDRLQTSLFRHSQRGENEWMGFFVPNSDEAASRLHERLNDTRDTLPAGDQEAEESEVYEMRKVQDNEIDFALHKAELEEISISVDDDAAYYIPIAGRTNLKRRRIDPIIRETLRDAEIDRIDLSLRESNPEESIERDKARSRYDPVTFG